MKIPSEEQVQQLINYLDEQARFHQWQMVNAQAASKKPSPLGDMLIGVAHKKASLCEGWAMALPALIELARQSPAADYTYIRLCPLCEHPAHGAGQPCFSTVNGQPCPCGQ